MGAPKSELKRFAGALATAAGRRAVREGIEVKVTRCPETGETLVLCRSDDRRMSSEA